MSSDISWVAAFDYGIPGEFQNSGNAFADESVSCVSDMYCFMGVRLPSLDEDFFIGGGSTSVVSFFFLDGGDYLLGEGFLFDEGIDVGSHGNECTKKLLILWGVLELAV